MDNHFAERMMIIHGNDFFNIYLLHVDISNYAVPKPET